MLPLMPTAALKAGEVVAPEPEPVLLARGVEVPAGVEPEPEPEPAEEEPAGEELVAVTEAEPDEEPDEEPVADAEEEDSPVLVLPLPVEVAVALVSEGALLEVEVVPAAVVVSTGGTTMGWPAEEHWETTALDTEIWSATSQAFLTQGVMVLTRAGFWQWQAKSVRDEQPSVVRAVTKQLSEQLGTSGS